MTKFHHHNENLSEFERSRGSRDRESYLTRRDFIQTGVVLLSGAVLPAFLAKLGNGGLRQEFTGKRIYIAPDDHTDLFWSADLQTYEKAFMDMLDYYLGLADQTQNEPAEFQSRWNCDGSFWSGPMKNRSQPEFERLIERTDGHVSILSQRTMRLFGWRPERVRGMYYPGKLERRRLALQACIFYREPDCRWSRALVWCRQPSVGKGFVPAHQSFRCFGT
jgi:hypothetical protein